MEMIDYEFIELIRSGVIDVISWLAEQDEDSIRERIYERIPDDLDISVGSYEYDSIEPANIEFAIIYFMLQQVILLAFPQYSFGKWLTLHAQIKGIERKEGTYASGKIKIIGKPGTIIPKGSKFSNTVTSLEADVKYYTTQQKVIIDETGIIEIEIIADKKGTIGNVLVGEISQNSSNIRDLISITNEKSLINGIDEESDESLLQRLLEAVRNPSSSGNKKDYKKWAKQISGVSDAEVIPLWNGPGTVKVIIMGVGGKPIPELVDTVKEYLDPKNHEGEGEGKATIGAIVTICTVENMEITVDIIRLEFQENFTLSILEKDIVESVKREMEKVKMGGLVRIHNIEDAIKHIKGIEDFNKILLNGMEENIQVPVHLKPIVTEVRFNE